MKNYLFKSERLGFRDWLDSDKSEMFIINSDPKVMEFFPSLPSQEQTEQFVEKMKHQFNEKGLCYFAVDKLINNEFIGFIGISEQDFKSDFTPCIDIGWRLSQKEWGKGYATEGAKRCLDYAFNELNIDEIKSICPIINEKSERVMEKLGMRKDKIFKHPLLSNFKELETCVLYSKVKKRNFN